MLRNKINIASREDLVYEAIKDSILRGEFKPSEVVNQSVIARQLGVSVIPVRAAISRLVAEGLLSQDPYHSAQVPALTKAELDEVLLISKTLEMLATRQAVPHIGTKDMEVLHELYLEMGRAMKAGELLEFGRLNREFHAAIYARCHLPRLRQMIADLWNMADINRYHAMFDLVPEMAAHAQAEHEQLLHFIETQQVEAAVNLVEAHKEYSRKCFLIAFENLKASGGN